jgi:hypothetical protein
MCRRSALKGLFETYESSPAGTYGGCLSEEPLEVAHHRLIFEWVSRLNIVMRENPFDVGVTASGSLWDRDDFTQVVDLSLGADLIRRSWTKGHRHAATAARRAGVSVTSAQCPEDWRGYYSAYEDSLRRWGTSARSIYSWRLFELLQRLPSDKVSLWLAKYEDVIIAGALCLLHNRHVAYWHGASLERYRRLRASHLLQASILDAACRDGYAWYDFNPSGGLEGVMSFKRGFGASLRPARILFRQRPAYRLYRAARIALSAACPIARAT